MNIPRFGVPVVVAAGLHGALFLIMPGKNGGDPFPPGNEIIGCTLGPIVEPPVTPPPETSDDAADAASAEPATPLPSLPERVSPPTSDRSAFTVPISTDAPILAPVVALPHTRGLPEGIGDDGGWRGTLPIPEAGTLDRMPRAVFRRPPVYPDAPRREGVDGSVTVEFVVDTEGRVIRAEAVEWSRREFVEPAVRAVRDWRFEPGTQKGRRVKFRMAVPIEFVHHAG